MPKPTLCIYYPEPGEKERARELSSSLGLPVVTDPAGYEFALVCSPDRLELIMPGHPRLRGAVSAEFVRGSVGYRRRQQKQELLCRAVGCSRQNPLCILDATGGLGRDSFILAEAGCTVRVLERHPVIAALLADGLQRAKRHPETARIAARISLTVADALSYLDQTVTPEEPYSVIYLDPMFPERDKRALVKKEMQMLQLLVGPRDGSELLLAKALNKAERKVVVKRPVRSDPLAGRPSYSLTGRTTRYDIYIVNRPAG